MHQIKRDSLKRGMSEKINVDVPGVMMNTTESARDSHDMILIVDDTHDHLAVMKKVIETSLPDVGVTTIQNSAEVISHMRTANIAVALLDVQMPGMDGIELCKLIKATEETKHVPVILITSHNTSPALRGKGLNAGADDFLARPMDNVELVAKIKVMLRIRRAEDELRAANAHLEQRVAARTLELYKSEKSLAKMERYYRGLLYSLHEDIFVIDRNYVITDINNTALTTTGHRREDVVGRHCFEVSHGYDKPCTEYGERCSLPEVFETGEVRNCCHEHKCVDGSVVHVDLLLSPMMDADGNVTHVIEAARDVSDLYATRDALDEQRGRAQTYLNLAGVMFVALDADGVVTLVNPKACAVLGYREEEIIGKDWFDLFLPERDRKAVKAVARQLLRGKTELVEYYENPILTKSGEERLIAWHNALLRDDGGAIIGTLASGEDITDRKLAEENLRQATETAEQLRSLLVEMTGAHTLKKALGKLLDAALNLCHMDGGVVYLFEDDLSVLQEHRGLAVDLVRAVERVPNALPLAQAVIGSRIPVDITQISEELTPLFREHGFQHVYGMRLRDGDKVIGTYCFGSRSEQPPTQADLQTITILAVETEALLKRLRGESERERLLAAIEQAAETMLITDAKGTIEYVNPAFELITGYTRDEAIGQNPRILKSGEHDDAFYKAMWETLARGEIWHGRFINRKKDSTLYIEDASISPVHDLAGKIINYVAVKRDVTNEIHIEEQLRQSQKMEAVGQLAGGIAHDFNNLLQVITGYVDMTLEEMPEDNPWRESIDEVQGASQRAVDLVRQLLAFSRRQVISPVDLDLNKLVSDLLKMIRRLIGEHISLNFTPGHELGTVHVDRGQIEQVLMNLCINARDSMPEGGKLTLKTTNALLDDEYCALHSEVSPGQYVLLSVSDTGCGIDGQRLERIFDPFFTTKEVGKGTGMGLATVHGIVKQHEGQIDVHSEVGVGSTFLIYLPLVANNEAESDHVAPVPIVGGTETILVVEDDVAVLGFARRVLQGAGYTVLTAQDGLEALHIADEHAGAIDMVLCDVVMPKLGGAETMQQMLERHPGLLHLFTSGYSDDAVHINFIQKQGFELLRKPYRRDELLFQIREVLDSKN